MEEMSFGSKGIVGVDTYGHTLRLRVVNHDEKGEETLAQVDLSFEEAQRVMSVMSKVLNGTFETRHG